MKIDFDHWQGAEIAQQTRNNVELEGQLLIIQALNPKLSKDGNKWCYLHGEMPNDCVVGFGDTPYLAMINFVANYYTQKP